MAATNEVREGFATNEQWNTAIAEVVNTEVKTQGRARCRRSHQRYAADGEIKVTGQIDGEPLNELWDLRQVSLVGISARSSREIPERARLEFELCINGHLLRVEGEVKHCTQTVGGYKVGIRLLFDE
jgi:hypothetical protein